MHPGAATTANLSSAKFCILPRAHLLLHKSPNQSYVKIPNPPPRFFPICCVSQNPSHSFTDKAPVKGSPDNLILDNLGDHEELQGDFKVQVGDANVVSYVSSLPRLSLSDQAFLLLGLIGCTISVAFTGFVIAAVPTLHAMGKAAISFSKLADTAREELPSTMAAIRLSGMEISDLTLELTDLSQEISDGVNKSAQTVQAAEAGIRQIGSLARNQTMSMIQERANLPVISIKPVVAGAAKKTSEAVGHATKSFMSIISGGELSSGDGSVLTKPVD